MQNNANIQQLDHEGKNCLNYAKDAMVEATIASKGCPAESLGVLVDLLIGLGCLEIVPVTTTTTGGGSASNNSSMTMSTSSAIV